MSEWEKAGWQADPGPKIKGVRTALDRVGTATTASDLARLWPEFKNAVADLEALAPAETHGTIGDFFLSVGRGVVQAQKELDQESIAYLLPKPAIPAWYRVPKASAEINFSITSTQKRSLNVLVYGGSEKNERRNEQKVSFDIVAVPPPPDLFARMGPFLVGSAVRQSIKERLVQYLESLSQPGAPVTDSANVGERLRALLSDFDATLIFTAQDSGDPSFSPGSIVDLPELQRQLKKHPRPVDQWLAKQVQTEKEASADSLVEKLNELLRGTSIYKPERFAGVSLSPETTALLNQDPQQGTSMARLNRLLLEDAYRGQLSSQWRLPPADVWVLVCPGTDEETPTRDDYSLEVVVLSLVRPERPKPDDIRVERKGWSRINYLALLLHGLAEEQKRALSRPAAGP